MKRIEITENEAVVLAEILEAYVSDLQTERVHTDKREWRIEFREREALVAGIIKRIKGEKSDAAVGAGA